MKVIFKLSLLVITLASSVAIARAQEASPTASPAPAAETKQQQAQPETAAQPAETAVAEKPAEANPSGPAPTIYFYRIKQFAGSGLEPSVYCDEKELARMDNGRYFGVTLTPGKHVCRMGDKQTGFEIDVKSDQTYYAKVSIDVGFWKGHGRLSLMQPEQGGFELKKVKLLGASKVRNRELVTHYDGNDKSSPAASETKP
ncbi:MAG TPA: DUF2846 domain-containing protein [Pyrinomonadaceae bacterium]|nr:DUF2846 domain-containing protein [Pyrinomonadaceae bacterium]